MLHPAADGHLLQHLTLQSSCGSRQHIRVSTPPPTAVTALCIVYLPVIYLFSATCTQKLSTGQCSNQGLKPGTGPQAKPKHRDFRHCTCTCTESAQHMHNIVSVPSWADHQHMHTCCATLNLHSGKPEGCSHLQPMCLSWGKAPSSQGLST